MTPLYIVIFLWLAGRLEKLVRGCGKLPGVPLVVETGGGGIGNVFVEL
jgi:hypothetical protein